MASYFFRNTGNSNWGTASNWSLTDGGGATGAVPTAADDAFFSNNSGPCVTNTTNRVCKTIDFTKGTGYTNTFTMTNILTVSGNVTLNAAMTIAGTAVLVINAAATITSNGKTWPTGIQLNAAVTITLSGNLTVTGLTNWNVVNTVNGNTWFMNGGFTCGAAVNGTTTIQIQGGTWTGGTISNNININGNITMSTTSVTYNTGTLQYLSGTVTFTTHTLVVGANATLTTNGINWYNIQISAGAWSLGSALTCTNNFTIATNTTQTGAFNITCANFINSAGQSTTFPAGITVTITSSLTLTGTASVQLVLKSSPANSSVFFNLNYGATQSVSFVTATDMDSSGGQTIWDYKGILTRAVNWNVLTPTSVGTLSKATAA